MLAQIYIPDEQGKMASSLQLQEGHDLLSRQPLGIYLEAAWHPKPGDFINLQLGSGHVSVSTLCETSACVCMFVHLQCVCLPGGKILIHEKKFAQN